jgi:hypothetical protein
MCKSLIFSGFCIDLFRDSGCTCRLGLAAFVYVPQIGLLQWNSSLRKTLSIEGIPKLPSSRDMTSGDQNSNLYLNVIHFFNTSVD